MNKIQCMLSVCAGLSMPVYADTTIVMQAGDDKEQTAMTISISAGKMRYELPKNNIFTVWDSATKTMTMVMTEDKRYMVMDEAYIQQMTQMAAAMSSAMSQMSNNPALGNMMGDMGKKMQAAQTESRKQRRFKKTSRTDRALNQNCKVWDVLVDEVKEGEFCTLSPSVFNMSEVDQKTMKDMAAFGARLAESMKSAMKMPGMPEMKQPEFSHVFDGNEFPVKYLKMENGKTYTAMEYKAINNSLIDKQLFAIPLDFKKVDMKMGQ